MSKLYLYCKYDVQTLQDDFDRSDWSGFHEEMYYNHRITYSLNKKDSGYQEAEYEVEDGKVYFLVYVLYETGGTFGCTHGMFHAVKLCDSRKAAEELKSAIEEYDSYDKYDKSPKSQDRFYEVDKYIKEQISIGEYSYIPWTGYFEKLEECLILTVIT